MSRLLLVVVLGACVGPGDKPDTHTTPDTLTVDGLDLSLAKIETVVRARWETATPTRSDVVATFEGGEITVSEAEPTTTHEVLLVGIPALTRVDVRVAAEGTDGVVEGTVTTGATPAWVPDLDYHAEDPDATEGGVRIVPVINAGGGGVLAVDDLGRVVWAWPPEDTGSPLTPFRARLSRDGTAVLFNEGAQAVDTYGHVWRVGLDGEGATRTGLLGSHTDFVEYADGGYAALGWDIREVEGRKILGDTIREVSPDGTERLVWSAWDDFTPDLSQTYGSFYPADPTVEDWTHINGISYDPDEDDFYVTITISNGVARVDRQSGDLVWWLSDFQGGDFANVDGHSRVEMPHSVQRIDGGVTVFSRGNPNNPSTCSAVVDIALDETTWEAREVWRHETEDCLLVTFLGGAERLPGGNTLVSWTTAGRLSEVTPSGGIAWQVSTPLGAAFGFSEQVPRLGP
ncbi:MAG: aryl-sulfate sulfotransferase [Myxococcota bacterium]